MPKTLEDCTKEELIDIIKGLKRRKKLGLVWEDKPEEIVSLCEANLPVVEQIPKLANFYPDYIVRYNDGSIGVYDTKAGRTVTEQPTYDKSDALQAYITKQNSYGAKLSGGILNKRNDEIYVYTGAEYTPDLDKWQRFTV